MLARDDVELLTARSGSEALELLLVHEVALAFLDVQMPDMDGFELAELMRGSERTRQVPIIFITARTHDQHRLFQGYESGAVDFLFKPIEPHILRNKADVFFQLHHQKQRGRGSLAAFRCGANRRISANSSSGWSRRCKRPILRGVSSSFAPVIRAVTGTRSGWLRSPPT